MSKCISAMQPPKNYIFLFFFTFQAFTCENVKTLNSIVYILTQWRHLTQNCINRQNYLYMKYFIAYISSYVSYMTIFRQQFFTVDFLGRNGSYLTQEMTTSNKYEFWFLDLKKNSFTTIFDLYAYLGSQILKI